MFLPAAATSGCSRRSFWRRAVRLVTYSAEAWQSAAIRLSSGLTLMMWGAVTDQGSAYIFVRSGSGWTQQAQLLATGGAAGDWFGFSVAISGETAVVGAAYDNVGANTDQGSAYVFVRSGSVWTQQTQLLSTGGAAGDAFGVSVGISGETAVIGADLDAVGANSEQGSAYVFTRSGNVWTQQTALTATDGTAFDRFGHSVAISGNTIVVGAYFDSVGANVAQGSAYVFTRSGSLWTQQAPSRAANGAGDDRFGVSVAVSGNTAVVGAHNDDIGANTNQGSAYVFVDGSPLQLTAAVSRKQHGTAGNFDIHYR
jgi:hypothetical protein